MHCILDIDEEKDECGKSEDLKSSQLSDNFTINRTKHETKPDLINRTEEIESNTYAILAKSLIHDSEDLETVPLKSMKDSSLLQEDSNDSVAIDIVEKEKEEYMYDIDKVNSTFKNEIHDHSSSAEDIQEYEVIEINSM